MSPTRPRPHTADRGALALAMALQAARAGRPWHAAIVTTDGQRREFHSLAELVKYLAEVSLDGPPPTGLR